VEGGSAFCSVIYHCSLFLVWFYSIYFVETTGHFYISMIMIITMMKPEGDDDDDGNKYYYYYTN